jgi:hypothetical protein
MHPDCFRDPQLIGRRLREGGTRNIERKQGGKSNSQHVTSVGALVFFRRRDNCKVSVSPSR